jgi:hypothetical protein
MLVGGAKMMQFTEMNTLKPLLWLLLLLLLLLLQC